MIKRPFLIFALVVSILVSGAVSFIQSARFAGIVKTIVARYFPNDVGVDGDFSEFAIKLFPPGVSIRNPRISVRKGNIIGLPPGSSINAERVDLNFLPFQMFSGDVRVNEVVVVNGDVRLLLDPSGLAKKAAHKSGKLELHWDELFQVHAEAFALENARLHLEGLRPDLALDLKAQSLKLRQWKGKGGLGYELSMDLSDIQGEFPKEWKAPSSIQRIRGSARVNALGLQVDNLVVQTEGIEALASGFLKGNVLNPKTLVAEASLNLKADASRAYLWLKSQTAGAVPRGGSPVDGRFSFSGKVKGNLERLAETLRAEGSFAGEGLRYEKWRAEQAHAEGSFTAAAGGGELSITKAVIVSPEVARQAGQGGQGGKITVGAFRMQFGKHEPITIPLDLEHAHIHWLAAPALKSIFGLDFRATGPVEIVFTPAGEGPGGLPWELKAKTGLTVENFQLDNQHLAQAKPLHRVLKIAKIRMDGDVLIDRSGIRPDLELSLGKTRLRVGGGIDFEDGFDLVASGDVNLEEVGQIAENEIRGQGGLKVHVHGPSARVLIDFDADVQDAYYLHLRLGTFKGRVTWDDDPSHLLFSQVLVRKGKTAYTCDGVVNLAAEDTILLNVGVPKGDIQDFVEIFADMTKDLWWFPRTLNGPVAGTIQISGGVALDRLEVAAKLTGTEWEYWGERFKAVSLTGGYDRGRYHVADLKAVKKAGRLLGRISFDQNRRFDWEFRTEDLLVSDFDHLAQLDVPLRGKVSFESSGKGVTGALKTETRAVVGEVAVRGVSMPPSQLMLRSENGILVARGTALGGQGTLDLTYDLSPGGASALRADLRHLDFSPLLLLWNSRLAQDPALAGYASGALNLTFQSGAVERGSGRVEISEYLLAKSDVAFRLSHPVSFRITDGSFDLPGLAVKGEQGEAVLNLRGRESRLEGDISGTLDVSLAEFFTSAVGGASGTAALDFTLGGGLKDPTIVGKATLEAVSVRVPSVESPFENVSGVFQLRQNLLNIQSFEAELAGGRVSSEGTVQIFGDRYPAVSIEAELSGSRLKIYPFQYVKARGNLRVHGDALPYTVDGSLVIDSALSREKVMNQRAGGGLKAMQYMPPPTSRREGGYPKFKLNIDAVAEKGIIVQNDLFVDAELKGRVKVVNTLETPRIVGRAEMIQGKMVFKNHVFQIQSASATFDNPTVIDPVFDMTASADINNAKVQLYAAGRMSGWHIEFSSNPSMPESEILSLLAIGLTSNDVKRFSAGDRSVVEQGEAASLILHSLDFNRDIQDKTGLQIHLDESVNSQVGTSAFTPQKAGDSAAAPKIVIKKQIVKNLDVSYGSTVGVGSNSEKEVNAELHVTPGFSVMGVWDNYEYDAVDLKARDSYGMDLKFQKRFK